MPHLKAHDLLQNISIPFGATFKAAFQVKGEISRNEQKAIKEEHLMAAKKKRTKKMCYSMVGISICMSMVLALAVLVGVDFAVVE